MSRKTIIILSRRAASALILWATMCGGSMAQTKDSIDTTVFTVGYDFKVNTTDKEGKAVTDSLRTVLLVGSKSTKSLGYYTDMVEQQGEERGSFGGKRKERCAHVPIIFVSQEKGQMTVREDVPAHRYEYTEPTGMAWNLLDDTLTISGFHCQKATTTYGGRSWTAYYTEDVPSTAGPWKLHGCPGLIVSASTDDGIFSFTLFELLQVRRPITSSCGDGFETSSIGGMMVKTKRDKLIKMRNKLFTDPRYLTNPVYYYIKSPSDKSGGDVFKDDIRVGEPIPPNSFYLVINGTAIPSAVNVYQPLELE